MPLPELIVFDLDFTLWDAGGTWCDCLSPPFSIQHGEVVDSLQRPVQLYRDAPAIFQFCIDHDLPMALASRTERPRWADELISLLEIKHLFSYREIYPSSKVQHFEALQNDSGIAASKMLFFDDEHRNIHEVSQLGVTCVLVREGLTDAAWNRGLIEYERNQSRV